MIQPDPREFFTIRELEELRRVGALKDAERRSALSAKTCSRVDAWIEAAMTSEIEAHRLIAPEPWHPPEHWPSVRDFFFRSILFPVLLKGEPVTTKRPDYLKPLPSGQPGGSPVSMPQPPKRDRRGYRQPNQRNTKLLGVHLPPVMVEEFKTAAKLQGKTSKELLTELVEMVIENHKTPEQRRKALERGIDRFAKSRAKLINRPR